VVDHAESVTMNKQPMKLNAKENHTLGNPEPTTQPLILP
jgi:hypothetical protein